MVDALCDKLTCLIRNNVQDIDEEKAEIINFGIKSMVSEATKTAAILGLAYILGVFNFVVIALISFGAYRIFAGGFHAKTHLACFTSNSVFVFLNVFLSMYMAARFEDLTILYSAVFIFNVVMIYIYAPADVEEKPILSTKLRERLKIQSYIVMSIIFIVALTVVRDSIITNILIISTLLESITLTPISYRLAKCNYGNK